MNDSTECQVGREMEFLFNIYVSCRYSDWEIASLKTVGTPKRASYSIFIRLVTEHFSDDTSDYAGG